ncbi:unnamed protein product [Heligmosomoides polygyrus]|uniref:Transposase n=1 Tax=Heligmosomoides polygyrus TaxID=6339 RepID=A0A183F496_HELPZ|nr:unnamed protein product [Heligmosomoides polygyrus]
MEFPISVGYIKALRSPHFVLLSSWIRKIKMNSSERFKLGVIAWSDLKSNRIGKKTEYLTTGVTESGSIKVNGIELSRTSVFMHLGSAIASDGRLMGEVNSRVSAAWSKWRSLTGVLCDRDITEHLKSKQNSISAGSSVRH